MTVIVKVLVPSQTVPAAQSTVYTAANVSAIIDKFTATNYSAAAATISVNLVTNPNVPGNENLMVKDRSLLPGETYTFPELVGHVIAPTGYISVIAGTATAINMRVSGREVT